MAGRKVQRSAAQQEHHSDDEEKEADRASSDVVEVGENGGEQEVHGLSFSWDGNSFAAVSVVKLLDGPGRYYGV